MSTASKSPSARLAVAGVGLVGRRHAEILAKEGTLVAVADPSPLAAGIATELGVPIYPNLRDLLSSEKPDGVVVATPNQSHEADGLACISAKVPVLIEKPLASDIAGAERLVAAAQASRVPLLVGHHRRYNPLITKAKTEILSGRLGDLVAVNALCWLYKPDGYFDVAWRREPGAGPVFINLIHDVELLLHFCGDVAAVQSAESNAVRGNNVEDTAVVILRFKSGVLGTITVSDTVTSPWSWELTAAENPSYPATGAFSYMIGGTRGSLSIPDLSLWANSGEQGWHEPIDREVLQAETADPLVLQLRHFAEVAQGKAEPHVTGADGLRALKVISAIKEAAKSGRVVEIP